MVRDGSGTCLSHVGSQSLRTVRLPGGNCLFKQGARNRLRRAAGAAPPSGGSELHAVNERGGKRTSEGPPRAQFSPLGGQRSTQSGKRGGNSDRQNVLLFTGNQFVHLGNIAVGEFLHFIMGTAFVIFRGEFVLDQFFHAIVGVAA